MTTPLNKPVTRRIGELVVTISAEGVSVRRPKGQKTAGLPWGVLSDLLNAENVRSRKKAMMLAPPRQWCPGVGDEVWLSADVSGRYAVGRVRAVRNGVVGVGPAIVVAVGPLCKRRELIVGLDDVRPLPAALATPDPPRPLFGKRVESGEC